VNVADTKIVDYGENRRRTKLTAETTPSSLSFPSPVVFPNPTVYISHLSFRFLRAPVFAVARNFLMGETFGLAAKRQKSKTSVIHFYYIRDIFQSY